MFCFDDNYVLPAVVAFYSMLDKANRDYFYRLYVVHDGLRESNQEKLKVIVKLFDNASIEFIGAGDVFGKLFSLTKSKGHYSKEMYFKFLAPTLLSEYEKIIISDVDVVYLGDVARDFVEFDAASDFYLAGSPGLVRQDSWVDKNSERYRDKFTEEEINKLLVGAGYFIFNITKMRIDGCQEKFINYAIKNAYRVLQPEQDVISLICHPHIKILPADSMVCTYSYEFYKSKDDFSKDLRYVADEVVSALENPVQLHYAGSEKPWSHPGCPRGHIWFEVLSKTPFLVDYLEFMDRKFRFDDAKKIFSMKLPFSRRKIVMVKLKD